MNTKPVTIEELNEIQREWMALDSAAPEKEKQRVFALMKRIPSAHLSVSKDKQWANVMVNSTPMFSRELGIDYAKGRLAELRDHPWHPHKDARLDIAWCGSEGKWVAV